MKAYELLEQSGHHQTALIFKRFSNRTVNVTKQTIKRLKEWMLIEHGYSPNTVAFHYSILKSVFPECSGIKIQKEETDKVYLTVEELKLLSDIELSGIEATVRDLFLLGAYTGARVSDFTQFTIDNLNDGVLKYMQQKTGKKVSIPVNQTVIDILNRGVRVVTRVEVNRTIKVVCKKAGINSTDVYFKRRYGKIDKEVKEKWEMVQSHTARRSFATNLALAGASLIYIQKLLGHTKVSMTEKYIACDLSDMDKDISILTHTFN